jgi:hypothetical protein
MESPVTSAQPVPALINRRGPAALLPAEVSPEEVSPAEVRLMPTMPATTSSTPSAPSSEGRSSRKKNAARGTSATPRPRAIG